MAQYRKRPLVIEATQWFRNGDHPEARRPEVGSDRLCEQCGKPMHEHGWIDTLEGVHVVCPGDWIITGVQGEVYPCKPDIFAATYEVA